MSYPSLFDRPEFPAILNMLPTEHDRQRFTEFIRTEHLLTEKCIDAQRELLGNVDDIANGFLKKLPQAEHLQVVRMLDECSHAIDREINRRATLDDDLGQTRFEMMSAVAIQGVYRYEEILHTHARLSWDDRDTVDEALATIRRSISQERDTTRVAMDVLIRQSFEGTNIVLESHLLKQKIFKIKTVDDYGYLTLKYRY